jgi:hypothetical protein
MADIFDNGSLYRYTYRRSRGGSLIAGPAKTSRATVFSYSPTLTLVLTLPTLSITGLSLVCDFPLSTQSDCDNASA